MLRKKGKKRRKVSRMNSLPLYPISTFTADHKILLGAGSWQSWKAAPGARCRAVASALPRCLGSPSSPAAQAEASGTAPALPAPSPQCLPLAGAASRFDLCSSRLWVK